MNMYMAQCKKLLTILGLPEYLLRNELYLHIKNRIDLERPLLQSALQFRC